MDGPSRDARTIFSIHMVVVLRIGADLSVDHSHPPQADRWPLPPVDIDVGDSDLVCAPRKPCRAGPYRVGKLFHDRVGPMRRNARYGIGVAVNDPQAG